MKLKKQKTLAGWTCLLLLSINYGHAAEHHTLRVSSLRSEYQTNPMGMDVTTPRLSWKIVSDERNVMQTAYEVRAAKSEADLKKGKALLWDSKKVVSGQSVNVEYAGEALQARERVYWQVRVYDNRNHVSEWSAPAFFEMGLLKPSDWQAKWIEPAIKEDTTRAQPCPMLRKEFSLGKKIKQARMYVSGHGLYELSLNGKKVSDQLFTPGWTSYNKRLQYQTYDVTSQLQQGKNAIGATLGDGWYRGGLTWDKRRNIYGNELALLLQLEIVYEDGTKEIITTDGSWKSSTGPILKSDIYDGEAYDARLEKPGWSSAGFNDNNWGRVETKNYTKDILVASYGPLVRACEEIKPVKIFKTPAGETVVDMGQNMVGWVRMNVTGNAGTKVTLKFAEVLDKKGNFYTENLRSAEQTDEYILKGGARETFEPHFTFHGFRYVKVGGFPGELTLDNLKGIVIHSDMTPSGAFTCSDSMVNRLQHNIQWGLKGNFLDVPTDCPQRDERLGWTGDAQVFSPTACFNMDAASFYTKWMKDFTVDQYANGSIPFVIPNMLHGGAAAGWADASVVIPYNIYLKYGDTAILQEQYGTMKGWVNYMRDTAGDSYLWNRGHQFADWCAFATTNSDYPGATTDKDLVATAYFAYSTSLLQKIATILGKKVDAGEYGRLFDKIKTAFEAEYITPNGRLSSNTQTAYVLALAFNLFPEAQQKEAAARLAEDVRKFGHITTGFLGTPLICQVLTQYGYADEAFMLLMNKNYPGWLYPITMGATTIWERWDGMKPDSTFQDKDMNSFNHYAYGAIGNWLYSSVAGLQSSTDEPGYKKIIIHPHTGGGLTSAKASYESVYGKVESGWKISGNEYTLNVVVPPNTTAEVYLPTQNKDGITEGGKPVSSLTDIKFVEGKDGQSVFKIGSGEYSFETKLGGK